MTTLPRATDAPFQLQPLVVHCWPDNAWPDLNCGKYAQLGCNTHASGLLYPPGFFKSALSRNSSTKKNSKNNTRVTWNENILLNFFQNLFWKIVETGRLVDRLTAWPGRNMLIFFSISFERLPLCSSWMKEQRLELLISEANDRPFSSGPPFSALKRQNLRIFFHFTPFFFYNSGSFSSAAPCVSAHRF